MHGYNLTSLLTNYFCEMLLPTYVEQDLLTCTLRSIWDRPQFLVGALVAQSLVTMYLCCVFCTVIYQICQKRVLPKLSGFLNMEMWLCQGTHVRISLIFITASVCGPVAACSHRVREVLDSILGWFKSKIGCTRYMV